MPRRSDKKARLIQAAVRLIQQQGYHTTTLAEIAQEAGIQLGNVYYYFRTKESIASAAIQHIADHWGDQFASWEHSYADPWERIEAYVDAYWANRQDISHFGCSTGSLCQELAKQGGALADEIATVLLAHVAWLTAQFLATGLERPEDYARYYVAEVQGMAAMLYIFKNPEYGYSIVQRIREQLHDYKALSMQSVAAA